MNITATTTAATKFVTYYRVSTQKQGASGLGLEAQQQLVKQYMAGQVSADVVASFTEVETGTSKKQRTEIFAALETARKERAVLVIAKLDRLARNVAFISALIESGVKFVAADMPHADTLQIHLMAAFAEYEAKIISERTKAALQAAKARGVKLGNKTNLHEAQKLGAAAQLAKAKEALKGATAYALELAANGLSLRKIAEKLNNAGMTTQRGGNFSAVQVKRMLDRTA